VIGPDYFSTMGIPFPRGNQFSDRDSAEVQGVAIINDAVARKYWPGEDPIGKRIKRGRPESKNPWVSIVGIVRAANQLSLREETQPEIYLPYLQNTSRTFTVVARTASDARMLAGPIGKEVRATDKDLPVSSMKLMEDLISNSVAQPRFYTTLLSIFAALALILAAVGVYGVMSYSVAVRTRDIGLRVALGARPLDIFRYVVGEALLLTLIGLGIGIALAVVSARLMKSLLYGVTSTDPLTLAAASLALLAVALLASYIPARRAIKIDPIVTLRYE
jgi:putative ABC transport system permease protein